MQLTTTGEKTPIHTYVLTETKRQLETLAKKYGVTQTVILNNLLVEALASHKELTKTTTIAKTILRKKK